MNNKTPSENDLAQQWGFKDANELEELISRINLIDPEEWRAFIKWAQEDCTKKGLERLLEGEEYSPYEDSDAPTIIRPSTRND